MDLRTQTSLVASILSFSIVVSVLLRERRHRIHWIFIWFASSIALWYLTFFLSRFLGGGSIWERVHLLAATWAPLPAIYFFRGFLDVQARRNVNLYRLSVLLGAGVSIGILSQFYKHIALGVVLFCYVTVLLYGSLLILWKGANQSPSRVTRERLRYVAIAGGLGAFFTLAEYLPYVGWDIPPVGTVFVLVLLFVLSQSFDEYRVIDLYELAARLTFLTATSFLLAGILWVLVQLDPGHFFLHSVVAALVLFLIFDPAKRFMEDKLKQLLIRERLSLNKAILDIQTQLGKTLSLQDMVRILLVGLEESRRVTDCAIYLMDLEGRGMDLSGSFGRDPQGRLDYSFYLKLFSALKTNEIIVYERLERELNDMRGLAASKQTREEKKELLAQLSGQLSVTGTVRAPIKIVIPFRNGQTLLGCLTLGDDRTRDAFSEDELELIASLGFHVSSALEHVTSYERLRAKDRLASLGEMSAGLAHEIRNPLGAIKASAQFISENPDDKETSKEFLGVIVDEVDRLNRLIESILGIARPVNSKASFRPSAADHSSSPCHCDMVAVLKKTLHMLGAENITGLQVTLDVPETLHAQIDSEQFTQVLLNLILNAIQATGHSETAQLEISMSPHLEQQHSEQERMVQVRISDNGPGIPPKVLDNLFVPFITTKEKGTGLGLALCHRIIAGAQGRIEIQSPKNRGTTVRVTLPRYLPTESDKMLSHWSGEHERAMIGPLTTSPKPS